MECDYIVPCSHKEFILESVRREKWFFLRIGDFDGTLIEGICCVCVCQGGGVGLLVGWGGVV